IVINGKTQGGAGTHSHGSYGHINIWNAPTASADAYKRYNHFVTKNYVSVTDVTTTSALWQPNYNSTSVVSVSAYKIG
ncbi:MAG: hypothetical protein EB127_25400, partial [Alphaproteobacteria bacterium]|nr:hypothetical protein [Alphaproteobacteria bacterium]